MPFQMCPEKLYDTSHDNKVIEKYRNDMHSVLPLLFPHLTFEDLDAAISYSIKKRYKKEPCKLYNNYKEKTVNSSIMDMTNFILDKEPIMTSWGVLFKKHGVLPNPITKLMETFMANRGIHKKQMLECPKYSAEWEKYNLYQLLDKQDCNSIYGILGLFSSVFYNLHVAASITATGQSCVSAMGMFFESFLSNNVKFGSLNEVIHFIDMVKSEKPNRMYKDQYILDRNISREECFLKIGTSIGWEWIPDDEDLEIIQKMIWSLDDETVNRVYYKNNLYEFMSNSRVFARIDSILSHLDTPFMDPNDPPECIKDELKELCDLMKEYVYYGYQIIDKIDRLRNMPRNVTLIIDTDSNLVSLDAFYRFVLNRVRDREYKIIGMETNVFKMMDTDVLNDTPWVINPFKMNDFKEKDYDFMDDEIIELERSMNPFVIKDSDNLRYSIINIIAYICSQLILDYMERYTMNNNSWSKDRKCMMIAKNEFLFKKVLMTLMKKNYASIQEIQEGKYLGSILDLKGLAIDKATMNDRTREALREILYEDILKIDEVDQVHVLKKIAMFEKEIHDSLACGEKKFFKPMSAKPPKEYIDPMKNQGVKSEIVWNHVCEDLPMFDMNDKNSFDIVKVDIRPDNIEPLKETHPLVYAGLRKLLPDVKMSEQKIKESNSLTALQKAFKGNIKAIAIPLSVEVIPDWIPNYINYTVITNDNLKNMPLESIGMSRNNNDKVNYTNIVGIC